MPRRGASRCGWCSTPSRARSRWTTSSPRSVCYDSWGVSGFIVTDPGAIELIRRLLPHTLIHVSIGSGITNAWDARFYQALGADVIILPYRWGEAEIAADRRGFGHRP